MAVIKVDGVGNAINALALLDKKAYKALTVEVKATAQVAQAAAIRNTPAMGLVSLSGRGGWGPWQRRGEAGPGADVGYRGNEIKASLKISTRRSSKKGSFRALITTTNAAASIFQTIGRGDKKNSQFSREVISQHGAAEQRFLWGVKDDPEVEAAQDAILALMYKAADETQRQLAS